MRTKKDRMSRRYLNTMKGSMKTSWTEKREMSEAYRVVIIEKPGYRELDIKENYWIGRTGATINVAGTIAPKYR